MSTTTTDTGMHPGERLLLYVLRELADAEGTVTTTHGDLAERCGWSARYTVRKRLHGLEDRGLLTINRNVDEFGSTLANTYTLRKG